MNTSEISTIADEAVKILVATIPAVTPYGPALELAFSMVANIAPPLYSEIKSMISGIKDGTPPTPEQIASLQAIIAGLKNPDHYFDPAPMAAVAPAPAAVSIGFVPHPATL